MLWDESNLVIERQNNAIVTEAELLQNAVMGILSKKARKSFSNLIKRLNVVTKPFRSEEE
jgi:hypothetical protein